MSLRPHLALLWVALATAGLSGCGSPESRAAEVRAELAGSNVIVFAFDSLAAGHTSTYRYERETTPNLTRLAEAGIRFADATAGSPSGFASTASLFRGEAVEFSGVREPGELAPPSPIGLAEAFRQKGYATRAVSTHAAFARELGCARGFDTFSAFDEPSSGGVSAAAAQLVEQALEPADERPFFTYVQLGEARAPRVANAERARALIGRVPDQRFGTPAALRQLSAGKPSPEHTLAALDLYDAVVHDLDFALGEWLELLDRSGRRNDTVVIVVGTCGQAFGQRGEFGVGGDLHQEQVSVPFVMRLPDDYLGGQVLDEPVALYDLYPTLADLFELDAAPRFASGNSLLPLLTDDWWERSFPVASSSIGARPEIALRRGHFKLIDSGRGEKEGKALLQHLERDPLETSDYSPQRPEIAASMQTDLRRFLAAAEAARRSPDRQELSPELRERLAALGYSLESGEDSDE